MLEGVWPSFTPPFSSLNISILGDMELAQRFFERFSGLERAHGQYRLNGQVSGKGKKEGHANTVREPLTVTHWERHLKGTLGIGIVPIREDNTCRWGAIDIDEYTGSLEELSDQVARMEIPLILCRSKSGGPHLYLFLSDDVPAELVRGKLMEWAVALGYSGVEVFPKQVSLAGENDVGNWINMPYFGDESEDGSLRFAIMGGKRLTAEQFLDLADMMAMDYDSLSEFKVTQPEEFGDMWEESPPCLQSLAMRGFGEGSRNNALFDIGVYLRKRYGDDGWEDLLDEYNQKYMDPPLGHKEVTSVARSVKRKTYEYRCGEQPICGACNKQICRTRQFGVGTVDGDPGVVLGTLVKLETEPPYWIWDVDGARLELSTSELKDQNRFHTKVIEVLNKWPTLVKPKQWAEIVRQKLQSVEIVDVPPDATQEGQMWALLEQYCTGKQGARTREEMLPPLYKPWTPREVSDVSEESYLGRTFFSAVHFKQYLEQNRLRVTERQLWSWLRNRGAEHHGFNIRGRFINVWSVPSFATMNEDFAVPKMEPM